MHTRIHWLGNRSVTCRRSLSHFWPGFLHGCRRCQSVWLVSATDRRAGKCATLYGWRFSGRLCRRFNVRDDCLGSDGGCVFAARLCRRLDPIRSCGATLSAGALGRRRVDVGRCCGDGSHWSGWIQSPGWSRMAELRDPGLAVHQCSCRAHTCLVAGCLSGKRVFQEECFSPRLQPKRLSTVSCEASQGRRS